MTNNKVTVSKLQIAQAKECVVRLDKYCSLLNVLLELCEIALPQAVYRQFPDIFQISQKRSLETIIHDLKSMKNEVQEMALYKAERAEELTKTRNAQLGVPNDN